MLKQTVRFSFLAVLLLAAVGLAACGGSTADIDTSTNGDDSALYDGDAPAPAVEDGGESVSSEPGGSGSQTLPGSLDRKIIRSASISLEVEDVPSVMGEIEDATLAAGGFVSGSSISTGDDDSEPQTATITIRVPAENYAAVMADLRSFAETVRSESSDTSEVTEEYTDLQSRLRNLEATEAQYLVLLEQVQTIDEILTVQDRLNATRAEIEQVTGRINQLDNLTELATISVSVFLPAAGITGSSEGWVQRAWETSWEVSAAVAVVLASGAIALAVLALWLIPIAIVGALGWRLFGRRIAGFLATLSGGASAPPAGTPGPG